MWVKHLELFIIDGGWSPRLLIFDANSFQQIQYSSTIEEAGDIAFSQDGKNMYKWQQYGWSAGFAGSNVFKYSIDGDKLNEVGQSNLGYPNLNRDPLDTPVIVLEGQGKIVYKDKVFNLNNLTELKRIFSEPIYAVDEKNNLAVGKTKIYNLETGEAVRFMPNHSTSNMFFDKAGKLHFFNGKDMYSLDLSAPIGKLETPVSVPANGEKEIPTDFPIIIKYGSEIDLVNENNIVISDGKSNYGVKALISDDMLIIAHEDLPYSSNITLEVGEDTISNLDGSKSNNKFTMSFSTGKEYNRMAGTNRYETSVKVSQEMPIILVGKDNFPEELQQYISDYDISKTYVIGGSGVISDNLVTKLPGAERIYGSDRYETNMKVLNKFQFYFGNTFIASGRGFADALSASALAGISEAPILLADESLVSSDKAMYELKNLRDKMKMKYTVGGEGSVPTYVIDKIFK
ncbi:cell wall-binding repeat-containing protein [Clostridium magnum]|uniref:N-acetylmuramoyl-L-alanine amidase LytC n=1 Tax=Clostridium magnum DSM 2767 TaxID=1121326 RepID=A0A162RAF5_9CLOT|nr:cell wall-binding repeat-containing protein [Clostridium magnum]KZL89629.1 N-acetylmuramoyl-L-alanine amidase LytC precursor [Clostridium magnum DSM 2767]SHH74671.1 Putative cell wall binding repeat 2 [Clostridium magnum DSM 2767]